MFVLNKALKLKTLKTTTERVLRSGFHNSNGCSPYLGVGSYINERLKTLSTASVEYLFEMQQDFDADVKHPQQFQEDDNIDPNRDAELYGTCDSYSPHTDTLDDFKGYYRKLEDVAVEYHTQYIENLLYSISYHDRGGILEYNRTHQAQLSLTDQESGNVISISDLELDEDESQWSSAEVQHALSKMPYVLKRLHNLSRFTGVHTLSYLGAYLRAEDAVTLNNANGGRLSLKSTTVVNEGFYMCNKAGNATTLATISAKNPKCVEMFDFVSGLSDAYPGYVEDVTNFLHYAEVLNIDLRHEKLHEYGADFIKGLVASTLTPNSQYDAAIHQKLLGATASKNVVQQKNEVSALLQSVREFYSSDYASSLHQSLDAAKQKATNIDVLRFLDSYYEARNISINLCSVHVKNGLYYYNDQLILIPDTDLVPSIYKPNLCVISAFGFLLSLVQDTTLYYLPISSAIYNTGRIAVNDTRSLHKWEALI